MMNNENIKKMFALGAWSIIMIISMSSCCDCPLDPYEEPIICKVREVTVTVFNPGITKVDDTTFVPVPEYSIHTYQFPNNDENSGSLPNDERFSDREQIPIAFQSMDGTSYFAAIMDRYPINADLKGDMMVISADPVTLSAVLRFKGSLLKLNNKFMSENATQFCEFINEEKDEIDEAKLDLILYGKGLPGTDIISYNSSNIDVIDANGRVVTNEPGVPFPQNDIITILLENVNEKAVNILVEIGDVFIYQAINGKLFVFVIADVKEGTFDPQKRRVSIMFNRIG